MAKQKAKRLLLLGVAALVLGPVVLKTVPRWLALRKVLDSPERVAMLAVTPEPKMQITTPGKAHSPAISIGYAEFELPAGVKFSMTSRANGEVVLLESDPLTLGFLPPGDANTSDLLALLNTMEEPGDPAGVERTEKPLRITGDAKTPAGANIVDLQLTAAEARPLPFMDIFLMNHAEFRGYIVKLLLKTILTQQAERIVPYEGPNSIGVIYIREGGTRGIVELTTHDRRISQAISFEAAEGGAAFPPPSLSTFLASYRFTVASCPSRERIAQRIAESGIIPRVPPEEQEPGLEERKEKLP